MQEPKDRAKAAAPCRGDNSRVLSHHLFVKRRGAEAAAISEQCQARGVRLAERVCCCGERRGDVDDSWHCYAAMRDACW